MDRISVHQAAEVLSSHGFSEVKGPFITTGGERIMVWINENSVNGEPYFFVPFDESGVPLKLYTAICEALRNDLGHRNCRSQTAALLSEIHVTSARSGCLSQIAYLRNSVCNRSINSGAPEFF